MRYIVVCLVWLLFSLQTSSGQSITLRTGVNISNERLKDIARERATVLPVEPVYNALSPKIGGNFGVLIEMPGEGALSFETGFILNTRGQNIEAYDADKELLYMTFEQQKIFLDIPASLKFTSSGERFRYFGSIGGYFGVGIWGWERIERRVLDSIARRTINDMTIVRDISWDDGFGDPNLTNRFEFGSIVSAGVEIGHVVINASYMYAWTSMSGHGGSNPHYVVSLTGGYKIDVASLFGRGGLLR